MTKRLRLRQRSVSTVKLCLLLAFTACLYGAVLSFAANSVAQMVDQAASGDRSEQFGADLSSLGELDSSKCGDRHSLTLLKQTADPGDCLQAEAQALDTRIEQQFESHPDVELFAALPGTGPQLAPPVYCGFWRGT